MARSHARVMCSIWRDADFVSLPLEQQRMYLLLLSQPDLSLCGALVLRPKRWARLCPDETVESVLAAVHGLAERGYVVIDEEHDELWIRSFIRYDGLLKVPNMVKAMWNAFDQLMSEPIRDAFQNEYEKAIAEGKPEGRGVGEGIGVGKGGEKSAVSNQSPPSPDCPFCFGTGDVFYATSGKRGPCSICARPALEVIDGEAG